MGPEFFIKLERFLIIIKLESIKLERSDCNAFLIELKRLRKKFCQSIVDSKVQMDITSFLSTE